MISTAAENRISTGRELEKDKSIKGWVRWEEWDGAEGGDGTLVNS